MSAFVALREALPRVRPVLDEAASLSRGRFQLETVRDDDGFVALEPEWRRLHEEAAPGNPFLSYEWVRSFWEAFGGGHELRIVVARGDEGLRGIAPLMSRREWTWGREVRWLTSMTNAHSPRFDFLAASNDDEVHEALWTRILASGDAWDALRLCDVPVGSRAAEVGVRLARERGLLTGLWPSYESPWLAVEGTFERYAARLRPKHRSNLRNRLKRLSARGKVAREVVEGGPQVARALQDGFEIEGAAWKRGRGTAIGEDPRARAFYVRLAERAAARGWLRLNFLVLDGKRIAFDYSLSCRGCSYLLKPGYDPDYAAYSPYNLLCSMELREAFDRGFVRYDFLGVSEPWKRTWTGEAVAHQWLYVLRDRPAARLWHRVKFGWLPRLRRWPAYRPCRDLLLQLLAVCGVVARSTATEAAGGASDVL